MTRKEYTETVLSALRHVTRREREAIRAEIDGHIEDHMADLLELDYPPELAEERTLSAMGDPTEVGEKLDLQYRLHWYFSRGMLILFSVCAVLAGWLWVSYAADMQDSLLLALQERVRPDLSHHFGPSGAVVAEKQLNVEIPVENDVVRVLRICTYCSIPWKERMVYVNVDSYDSFPLGFADNQTLILESQGGTQAEIRVTGSNPWWHTGDGAVAIDEEDTYITLRCKRDGASAELRILLPEERS